MLNGTSFSLYRGEILGLVGESGCGKSLLARTLVRLESPARIVSGTIKLDGREISTPQRQKEMRKYRGRKISLVLQNPKSAMDSVFTVGRHFKDVFSIRHGLTNYTDKTNKKSIQYEINKLLQAVGISSPEERSRQYPHQWSRGMLQRAQLQMTFVTMPDVIILDEVTSALDPTVTMQTLCVIRQLTENKDSAIIFITHDLSVALEICDRIAVMEKGRIVESGPAREIILTPSNSYTK
ncbi:MAG: ABC transporter ATP-binding protein, partial [Desulfobulbaceae bacterium]|nr:ABC transporter ATP-binding protein [Desulfobulbaceae bacterium]